MHFEHNEMPSMLFQIFSSLITLGSWIIKHFHFRYKLPSKQKDITIVQQHNSRTMQKGYRRTTGYQFHHQMNEYNENIGNSFRITF